MEKQYRIGAMILIVIMLIVCSLSIDAQILTLRAHSYKMFEEGEVVEQEDVNLIIVLNLKDDIISIDNAGRWKFYLRYLGEETDGIDDENDKYTYWPFNCYDTEGYKCVIGHIDYEDYDYEIIIVSYSKISVWYYCSRLNYVPKEEPSKIIKP